ncbi:UTP--glucose-1-phosphate uridylyltransferase [subsurface metagenome]
MDALDKKLLIVIKDGLFCGLLSAGDIQRAIIRNKSMDTLVEGVLRENVRIARPDDLFETIKMMMIEFRMEFCPVVNDKNEITKIYFWDDLFHDTKSLPVKQFNLPIVIMAGGLGNRLKPLTNVIPKPLIPLNNKTIIEEIIENFSNHGCSKYYITVNYKADLIEYYLTNLPYSLEFIRESTPLGTAGSLFLLKGIINDPFFVSNCDIVIQQDYSEIYDYHIQYNNEITIVAALKHYPIPYGTIESGEKGQLISILEKPELTFKINSGMYILEPDLLNEIPPNELFHITDLIKNVKHRKGRVGVFPVSEKSWMDIGVWDEYSKFIKQDIDK